MWQFLSFVGSIITGLGLGSLVSVWLAQRWEKKKLVYLTKLDTYSSFIDIYQEFVAEPNNEKLKQHCVSCQKKIELIAPITIVELSRKFYQVTPNEGVKVRDRLIEVMRLDLGSL